MFADLCFTFLKPLLLLLDDLLLQDLINRVGDLLAPGDREDVLTEDLQTFVEHVKRQ